MRMVYARTDIPEYSFYEHRDYRWANLCLTHDTEYTSGPVEGLVCRVDPYCEDPVSGFIDEGEGNLVCEGEFEFREKPLGNSAAKLYGTCLQEAFDPHGPTDLRVRVTLTGAVWQGDHGAEDSASFLLSPDETKYVELNATNKDWCLGYYTDYADFELYLMNAAQNY